jgi:hypothetical protein
MTVMTGQPPTPPSDVWPLPIPDGTRAAAIPERLRELLSNARLGARVIHRRSVADPVLRHVLRAELLLRLGQRQVALTHARTAIQALGEHEPPGAGRLLLAMTVLVDIRCCTGDPLTADTCTSLLDLARDHGDQPRAVLAEALYCVAVYQHTDCRCGRRLLGELTDRYRRSHGDTPVTGLLTDGLNSMRHRCAQPPAAPPLATTPLGVLPGGLLHPDLRRPPAGYLRSRIDTQPGSHRCRPSSEPTAVPAVTGQAS